MHLMNTSSTKLSRRARGLCAWALALALLCAGATLLAPNPACAEDTFFQVALDTIGRPPNMGAAAAKHYYLDRRFKDGMSKGDASHATYGFCDEKAKEYRDQERFICDCRKMIQNITSRYDR